MQAQVVSPKESPQVRAFDEKMVPLKQRRNALNAQVSKMLTVVNPHTIQPTQTERSLVEARLSLPQVQADLARVGLDIKDLEYARAKVLNAEQARVAGEIDRQIGERAAKMRQLLTSVIPVNREIHELQELKERLTGKPIVDWYSWWELFEEAGDETRWGLWCRSIAENFGV